MARAIVENVRPGWRVFLGTEVVGRVVETESGRLTVADEQAAGTPITIPFAMIDEAGNGIVDLRADRETQIRLEEARSAASWVEPSSQA